MEKILIISRFNEDISWVKNYDYSYIIYNKGDDIIGSYNIKKVDNVGNNQRDIFQYIYENYDNLPKLMVFLQWYPYDHCRKEILDGLILNTSFTSLENYEGNEIKDIDGGFMEINNSWYINHFNRVYNQSCAWHSFDHFMETCFNNYKPEARNRFSPGSQYIITNDIALYYPKNFWFYLMNILNKNHMTEGHIIERSLTKIFSCSLELRGV